MKTEQKRNILFLTTANLAMKPRLVKEIRLAKKEFSHITLISFSIENWTDKIHLGLCADLEIEHHEIFATKRGWLSWFVSSVLQRFCMTIWPVFKDNLFVSAFASNKRTIQLLLLLTRFKGDFDIVNGRNTATLFPIFYFSKKQKCLFSFDIEDYHPGENVTWTNPAQERFRRELLMRKILPLSTFITVAGQPILHEVKKLVTSSTHPGLTSVENSFSSSEFEDRIPDHNSTIKFVWYSVDISRNRGLETFLPILYEYRGKIKITLIGAIIPEFFNNFLSHYQEIIEFVAPLPQIELHKYLASFDIGLAIETNQLDLNKQLAISNKIFAYTQSGLYVISTNTMGQRYFMEKNKYAGVIVNEENHQHIHDALNYILNNIQTIRGRKSHRFKAAKRLSWEIESEKLIRLWHESDDLNSVRKNN